MGCTKDGGQFDSFTGATITPRAVVDALAKTLAYVETHPEIVGVKMRLTTVGSTVCGTEIRGLFNY